MSEPSFNEYIAPFKLARGAQRIRGTLPLAAMERLGGYLVSREGEARFDFTFGIDDERHYFARGSASASLRMECQRCRETVTVEVSADTSVAFVGSDDQARALPEHYEPVVVEEERLSLGELVEEELILALPLVATHARGSCRSGFEPEPEAAAEPDEERENPFAVLASLKGDDRG